MELSATLYMHANERGGAYITRGLKSIIPSKRELFEAFPCSSNCCEISIRQMYKDFLFKIKKIEVQNKASIFLTTYSQTTLRVPVGFLLLSFVS